MEPSPTAAVASDCCAIATGSEERCPRCAAPGALVGPTPVQAHRPGVGAGEWHFCATVSCPVVFFADREIVTDDEVVARVGSKANTKPVPVCYCFAHTEADIVADLDANGTSTISDDVRAAVAAGMCACEHLNPSGKCCLPDIRRTVTAARRSAGLGGD